MSVGVLMSVVSWRIIHNRRIVESHDFDDLDRALGSDLRKERYEKI
jgi:hypothetical protein